jgi:hypothetical protein
MYEPNQGQNFNPYPNPMPAGGTGYGGMMPSGPNGPQSESDKYLLDMKISQQSSKASKTLGILSIPLALLICVVGLILGILAIVNANKAEKISYSQDSKVGKICGIAGIVLSVAVMALGIVFSTAIVQELSDIFGSTKEKQFYIKDKIVITMTGEYKEVTDYHTEFTEGYSTAVGNRAVVFSSTPVAPLSGSGLAIGNMSAENWRDFYFSQNNQFKIDKLINKDEFGITGAEISYSQVDAQGINQTLKSLMIFYKSEDDLWVINFGSPESNYHENRDEFIKFAKSIRNDYSNGY